MNGVSVITLDGPAASGKSSVARRVAERLGVPFVSSGLLYRAAAWVVGRV
ncbi:MAG: (d)CMP kinase, partial [Deinococcales bacterium]